MTHTSFTYIMTATLFVTPAMAQELEYVCPIAKIKEAYVAITGPQKILSALTVEQHVLRICRQSQEIIFEIAANNTKLQGLYGMQETQPAAGEDSGSGDDPEVAPLPPLPEVVLVAIMSVPSPADVTALGAILKVEDHIIDVKIGDTIAVGGIITTITADEVHISFLDGRGLRVEWGEAPEADIKAEDGDAAR